MIDLNGAWQGCLEEAGTLAASFSTLMIAVCALLLVVAIWGGYAETNRKKRRREAIHVSMKDSSNPLTFPISL
jgi:hypothetical protein